MSNWTKDRVNGGEFHTVKRAPTRRTGYSIAVLEYRYYNGNTGFEVVRTSPVGFVTLHRVKTEAEARKHANIEWAADMGHAPVELQPVCVGANPL